MITPALAGLENDYLVTFFTHHAILILFPIWNIVVDGMVTTRGAIREDAVRESDGHPGRIVNWLIGSNYMYLCTKPESTARSRWRLAVACSGWKPSPCY